MTRAGDGPRSRSRHLRDAALMVAAVGLAFLALDDITTDVSMSFALERTALVGCALCCGFVAWRLVRERHRMAGGLSFGLLALATMVQPAVGPGMNPTRLAYVVTVGTLVWFVGLGGMLARWAWRSGHERPRSR